MHFKLQQLLIS